MNFCSDIACKSIMKISEAGHSFPTKPTAYCSKLNSRNDHVIPCNDACIPRCDGHQKKKKKKKSVTIYAFIFVGDRAWGGIKQQ